MMIKANLASQIKTISVEAKEEIARNLLDMERLQKKMKEAANQGFESIIITPKDPIEIHLTEAAEVVTCMLIEMGFNAIWECETVVPVNADNHTGIAQRGSSLVISWSSSLGMDSSKIPRIVDFNVTH